VIGTNASAIATTAMAATEAPPIVLPSFTASKLLSGVLLVTVGTPLLVLVLGSTGCADAGRGVRERAGRKRNSMGKVVEEEKKSQAR